MRRPPRLGGDLLFPRNNQQHGPEDRAVSRSVVPHVESRTYEDEFPDVGRDDRGKVLGREDGRDDHDDHRAVRMLLDEFDDIEEGLLLLARYHHEIDSSRFLRTRKGNGAIGIDHVLSDDGGEIWSSTDVEGPQLHRKEGHVGARVHRGREVNAGRDDGNGQAVDVRGEGDPVGPEEDDSGVWEEGLVKVSGTAAERHQEDRSPGFRDGLFDPRREISKGGVDVVSLLPSDGETVEGRIGGAGVEDGRESTEKKAFEHVEKMARRPRLLVETLGDGLLETFHELLVFWYSNTLFRPSRRDEDDEQHEDDGSDDGTDDDRSPRQERPFLYRGRWGPDGRHRGGR